MEAIGIMGFIFGLSALGKIIMLEKQLKESGVYEIIEPFWFSEFSEKVSSIFSI